MEQDQQDRDQELDVVREDPAVVGKDAWGAIKPEQDRSETVSARHVEQPSRISGESHVILILVQTVGQV